LADSRSFCWTQEIKNLAPTLKIFTDEAREVRHALSAPRYKLKKQDEVPESRAGKRALCAHTTPLARNVNVHSQESLRELRA
jgi:hypothetical protein